MGRPIVYKLQDLKSEDSTGIYYEDELSPNDETDDTTYKVEKVLGKKTAQAKCLCWYSTKGGQKNSTSGFRQKM